MNSIVVLAGIVITLLTGIPVLIQLLRDHPRGLFILFFVEMWERFSYYGMRGLLIFYLTQHFLFDDKFSSTQYGSYTTLVYLLPLIGGLLADRYIGTRKAVAFGALLLVAGHFSMAIEGRPATQLLSYNNAQYQVVTTGRGDEQASKLKVGEGLYDYGGSPDGGLAIKGLPAASPVPAVLPKGSYTLSEQRDPMYVGIFYLALSLIIMGVGFLKPNISSIVGQLYRKGDPRRDPGFTLYYYGVNLGAFWAAILCGYLGQRVGWWAGFGLAGVGMLVGYLAFVIGKPLLEGHGEPPDPERLKQPVVGPLNREHLIYLAGLLGVGLVYVVVQETRLVGWGLGLGSVIVLGYLGWFMATKCTRVERDRLALALVLTAGSVVFFTLFEQAGTSLNLFAERNTNLGLIASPVVVDFVGRHWFFGTQQMLAASGMTDVVWIDMGFTAAQTQSFNAGFILIFAPIFAAIWAGLGRRGRDPNPVFKFGLGLLQVGLGFLVIVWSAGLADSAFRMPLLILAFTYLLHTTGELCLSPVGLSEITKLAPLTIISFLMAVWFLASSWAQYIGGWIAALAGTETVGGQVLDNRVALETAVHMFNIIGWVGVGFGVLFFVLAPFLKHWAHGVNEADGPESELAMDADRQAGPLNERPV
ncbi:MAG TPA: MFS transporter [Caulobacteraceae bacterium]|nr:MFS transporter [Caulobacteraceae bacterium]